MKHQTYQKLVYGFFALLLAVGVVSKIVAEDFQAPQLVIKNISETLQAKLQNRAFTQDFLQVTRFVNDVIQPHTDFDVIAPLVLGKYWKTASAEEKESFKHEFQTLLVRAYSRAFVEYNDWSINYLPLNVPNDQSKVVVKTKVMQPRIEPVDVDYRMYLKNGDWKVYDIMIAGVSLVTNYRTTFSEDIQKKGSLKVVIDDLAKRNTEALKAN